MSLDIRLTGETNMEPCTCPHCGNEHRYVDVKTIYDANITHNLGRMANAAGIYDCLWRARENGFVKAAQLIVPLHRGITEMRMNPTRYRQYDAKNGWGTYDDFLPWLERLLAECEEHPDADVSVSV